MSDTNQEELNALYKIVLGTADATGERFFRELARHTAAALDVQYTFVSVFTLDAARMLMLAFWDGERFHDIGEYEVAPTPCSQVVTGNVFHCPRGIQARFPEDKDLVTLHAESYRGVPLIGPTGKHLGHLAALDTKPMEAEPRLIRTMQIFAIRAAAELERVQAEAAVAASERRLTAILQSAMDAIVNVDAERNVMVFNAAAERVFRCAAAEVIGTPFDRFLSPELCKRLPKYLKDLSVEGWHDEWLWVPEGLSAVRANGEEFPIEATVSHVKIEGRDHFTLILRDINERLAAREQIKRLNRERDNLAEVLKREHDFDAIIGRSPAIQDVLRQVQLVANTDTSVLILGESGTGKELIARALHVKSSRYAHPLIKVDCGAIPENLIESELFGHEKGSFTGATQQRLGRFELADKGTVFLDEIGELPLALQSRLLRVLQEQEFERVGSSKTTKVDVRVIAATNRNLKALVAEQKFREDLYYRLNVFPLQVPPLRERPTDIPLLAQFFANRYAKKLGRRIERISDAAMRMLLDYAWPGNIRELENVIERAVILATGPTLELDLSFDVGEVAPADAVPGNVGDQGPTTLREMERQHILEVLDRTGGVIEGPKGAAKLLDINPNTLRSRMRKLGIRWSRSA